MGRSGGGGCGICRLLNMALTLALLGAGGYVLWYYLGQPSAQEIRDTLGQIDFGDFTDVLDNFTGFDPGFFNEDPYVGDNTTQLWRGHTDGEGGLTLTLQNSLDDNWYSEFDEAVSDWNNCNPRVLELSTTTIEIDHTCTHNDGVMKVCNGNYGDTGWLGINEVMKTVPQGIIQSSTAKMNEYYLNNAGYDERLYTMCHEIGHGFGLPHTDENFNNKDLGNCLDYTNRPSNNLRPGDVNCQRLLSMYGSFEQRRLNQQQQQSLRRNRNGPVERYLERYSDEYEKALQDLSRHFTNGRSLSTSSSLIAGGWRRLDTNPDPRGGTFQRQLREDLIVEVHVLFPADRQPLN
mmetsp:Transcript_61503/g.150532  ORF Transcript_61503/g.150532 Transcript_61503/m.150532 type:complete len:348 (+) Transcript_61503:222-1265(+)